MEGQGARVESEDHPAVGTVKVYGFDSWRSLKHFFLDFQSEWHAESNIKLHMGPQNDIINIAVKCSKASLTSTNSSNNPRADSRSRATPFPYIR